MAGCAFFSGFWSKDTNLSAVHEVGHASSSEVHQAAGTVDLHSSTALVYEIDEHDHATSKPEPKLLGLTRPNLFKLLFWMGSFTALLTAFYTFRAVFMTFWGPEKIPHEAGHHAHESPGVMCVPLWILAVGALGLGALLDQHTTGIFNRFLGMSIPGLTAEAEHHHANVFVMGVSALVFC